ncbi:hypothetical protein H7171_01440 [Candidatus Saccharibacteria bacterium]|nr:hypothetical protein [Candidatus Saccharibacteria bacterium]
MRLYIVTAASIVVLLIIALVVRKYRPRKLNSDAYTARWQAIQKNCANKKTWTVAVVEADSLLDEVLKRRKYKGKTAGERLVKAQHDLKNNESVWFGHKLCNRIKQENLKKISKHDTLESLSGFRQALKDLGALPEKVVTTPQIIKPETIAPETEPLA